MDAKKDQSKPEHRTNKRRLAALFAGLILLAFGLGIASAQLFGKPGFRVPESVAIKVTFPIYLPKQLPGNFTIVENSFSFNEGALIFSAKDSTGASIVFTEQKREPNFDFTGFYNSQLTDAKTLSNVPFPSVTGKAKTGQTWILSVVTDETWVFVSTRSPLNQEDMQILSANLQLSRK